MIPSRAPLRTASAWWRSLGFFGLLGLFQAITRNVQFQNHAVVHQPVDGRRRGHRIFENGFPLRERQVARDQDAATLVTLRQEREQYLHLLSALLHIADVVDEESLETV